MYNVAFRARNSARNRPTYNNQTKSEIDKVTRQILNQKVPKVKKLEVGVGRFTYQAQGDKMLADGQQRSTHFFYRVLKCTERIGTKLRNSFPPDHQARPEHTHKNTFKSY